MISRFIILSLVALLVLPACGQSPEAQANAAAAGSVWVVESPTACLYLCGTIHLLREKDYPLPHVYERAYADSQRLVFELPPQQGREAELSTKMQAAGDFPDGEALSDQIKEEAWVALNGWAKNRGLNVGTFNTMRPWFVALIISATEYAALGADPERGVDRVLAPYASARAIELLLDLAGGTYCGMTAVEAPFDPTVIVMKADEPARIAGMPIERDVVISLLTSVGCEVDGDEMLTVTAPTWRPDLTDPADLVEEVVRLVGYDTLPSTLPIAALGHGLTPAQRMRRRVGTALAARGAVEVLTYPFVGPAELDALRLPADDPRRVTAKLANPISDEQPHLRGTLVPGLLAAAQRNLGRGTTHLRLFEIGSVFQGALGAPVGRVSVDDRPTSAQWNAINAQLPQQPCHVAVVLTGDHSPAGWWGPAVPQTWAAAIEHARLIGDCLGVTISVVQGDDPMLHPGRAARLLVGDAQVGMAGELHPRSVEAMGLPERTCVMEIDLSAVMAAAPEVRPAPAVSGHPVAKEDIALVVDATIPVSSVQSAVAAGAGELLESVRLFDVYSGAQVPEGKRSLAFALRFRAADRTLSAADIASAREASIAEAARQCGAVLR